MIERQTEHAARSGRATVNGQGLWPGGMAAFGAREFLRVSELAPLLGVTSGRVYQLVAEGEVPATRVGRALRIPRPALEAWLQRCAADASRNAKHAAARRAVTQPGPASGSERAIIAALVAMARDHIHGWCGSATELLGRLAEYHWIEADELMLSRMNGRTLAGVLRQLVVHLQREGVQVSLGQRGFRGKRLVSIRAAGSGTVAGIPSRASRKERAKAAPSRGSGSARTHADAGDGGFTGVLEVEVEAGEAVSGQGTPRDADTPSFTADYEPRRRR